MNKQYAQVGTNTVVAGGTAETVALGFKPSYVRALNVNNLATYEHWEGMDDDTDLTTITAGTMSINAAGGITLTSNGFTLGVDICDTTDDVVRWVAFR